VAALAPPKSNNIDRILRAFITIPYLEKSLNMRFN